MIHPDFTCGPPTMFICGDDEKAKKMVIETILTPFGWETIDIGGVGRTSCNALDITLF